MKSHILILLCILSGFLTGYADDRNFWNAKATSRLHENLKLERVLKKAKNVVFFLGDGMGISTLTATRILKSEQRHNTAPYFEPLSFEKWPYVSLSMTHSTDFQVTDSAAAATAFLTGVKTKSGLLGVDSSVVFNNCSSYDKSKDLTSFLAIAVAQKKAVGLVSTTRITHATPAAAYAHSPSRNWESDTDRNVHVPAELRARCPDIAAQLVENAMHFRVILGGGREKFFPKSQNGSRTGLSIVARWKANQKIRRRRFSYIETGQELRELDTSKTDYLLGLFSQSHMDYEYERINKGRVQPSLEEMTTKAIEILRREKNGFVLFVEGGRIDHAHHQNMANFAMIETMALDAAVSKAQKLVNLDDTLMLVSADHSHVLTIGGYPSLQNRILGITDHDFGNGKGNAKDNKSFTTLQYANGPSAPVNTIRSNVKDFQTRIVKYNQQALVPLSSETHGGEDVGLYARGPMAHLLQGVYEQNYIAHVIMYNQCFGPYTGKEHCNQSVRAGPSLGLIGLISFALSMRQFF